MRKFSCKFIVTIGIICLFSAFAHGMKRKATAIPEDPILSTIFYNETLPSEIVKQIFTDLCDISSISINVPLVQKTSISGFSSFNIAPKGIVGYLVTMRSVCKYWHDHVFSPVEIKKILKIDIRDIVHDLDLIDVFDNQKNYSHAQFLAEMINGDEKACKDIIPSFIWFGHDIPKLEILMNNRVIEQIHIKNIVIKMIFYRCYRFFERFFMPILVVSVFGIAIYFFLMTGSECDKNDALRCDFLHCRPSARLEFCEKNSQMLSNQKFCKAVFDWPQDKCMQILYEICMCYRDWKTAFSYR